MIFFHLKKNDKIEIRIHGTGEMLSFCEYVA